MSKRIFTERSVQQFIKRDSHSLLEIAEYFNVPPKAVKQMLVKMKKQHYNIIDEEGSQIGLGTDMNVGPVTHPFDPKMWQGEVMKFGFTSDNHLCNYNSREDVLNCLYDIFEDEGIQIVFNGGNMVDGEFRYNKNELHTFGCTNQLRYCAQNFPYRKGITTKFVVGDDHEGWYVQREGINVGEHLVELRKKEGHNDFQYLGYGEADLLLSDPSEPDKSWLRLVHAGGGTAYATSYTVQKLVESYQGGEKPKIILVGHYHKMDYSYPREVHAVQLGTTCDQTLFMRKQKIQAHVGGGTIEVRRDKMGIINRVKVEYITFFDKEFYIGKDKYFKG
jgi:hypothetical protein